MVQVAVGATDNFVGSQMASGIVGGLVGSQVAMEGCRSSLGVAVDHEEFETNFGSD